MDCFDLVARTGKGKKSGTRPNRRSRYITPFLLATEELQSLLYSILAEGEIEFVRSEISGEDDNGEEITYYEALEVVYVIIKYFGWSWYLYRYSSYTQDKTAIELTRNISETFADRQILGQDAFRFTFTKQRSLGQMFVRRLSDTNSPYPEFKATPLFQFLQEIVESKNNNEPLYQGIARTVKAICRSTSVNDLEGYRRLIQVQNQLVDLLNYIESQEGFSVSSKKRRKTRLIRDSILVEEDSTLNPITVSPAAHDLQVVHKIKGRMRVKIPQLLLDPSYARDLETHLPTITGVDSIHINQQAASLTIYYNQQILEDEALIRAIINRDCI